MRTLIFTALAGIWLSGPARADDQMLFDDGHIRLIEVTRRAGDAQPMPNPLPSIIAVHRAQNAPAPASAVGGTAAAAGNVAVPPQGKTLPWCQARGAGFVDVNPPSGSADQHYYRVDYQRIDGEQLAANWQQWYPWAVNNVPKAEDLGNARRPGQAYSADWPFPMLYDALVAAPANHYLRYEDENIQLIEVMIRPGERENIHGHPYPSVFFDDGGGFYPPIETTNFYPFPSSVVPRGELGKPPAGSTYPQCYAAIPQAPHTVTVTGKVPQHFFRLQYKTM